MSNDALGIIRQAAAGNAVTPEAKHQAGGMGTRLQGQGFQDIIYGNWGKAHRP